MNRFVVCEKRNPCYDEMEDKWIIQGLGFYIQDKEEKIPCMQFLTEEDMMAVYDLLKSKHMIFHD